MDIYKKLIIKPGKKIILKEYDPAFTSNIQNKDQIEKKLEENISRLIELHYLLYAEHKKSVLIVLQGMDTAGKDGTIRHVFSGVNPQGCQVYSFKEPSVEELNHDFLWRIHNKVPASGNIGIFNRSHYEDVLVTRVNELIPKETWNSRYEQINNFEKSLSQNNVKIIKFFLHISKEEQKKRLMKRQNDQKKYWEFNPSDLKNRESWDKYMKAYEDVLNKCSTEWAPWFIIPADNKWFRNFAVSQMIVETLKSMNIKSPKHLSSKSKPNLKTNSA